MRIDRRHDKRRRKQLRRGGCRCIFGHEPNPSDREAESELRWHRDTSGPAGKAKLLASRLDGIKPAHGQRQRCWHGKLSRRKQTAGLLAEARPCAIQNRPAETAGYFTLPAEMAGLGGHVNSSSCRKRELESPWPPCYTRVPAPPRCRFAARTRGRSRSFPPAATHTGSR